MCCDFSQDGNSIVWVGHTSCVQCLAFNKDGNLSVSGSDDKTLCIWNALDGTCQSTLTGHTGPVTRVEFIDADTVVSSSVDGSVLAWDIATGTQKAEFEGEDFEFTFRSGDEQKVGQYVVTKRGNLVLVHTMAEGASAEAERKAVAFFHALGDVTVLECAGDRIMVGCKNGEVLHLKAPWLVEEAFV